MRILGGVAVSVAFALVAACGARTELGAPEHFDGGLPDVEPDVALDVAHEPDVGVEDAPPPVDAVPDVPILPLYGTRITAASSSTCAINSAGGVECWGEDFYGELGNNTTGVFNTPQQVIGLTSGVVAIAADVFSVCAVTNAGTATCWGRTTTGSSVTG